VSLPGVARASSEFRESCAASSESSATTTSDPCCTTGSPCSSTRPGRGGHRDRGRHAGADCTRATGWSRTCSTAPTWPLLGGRVGHRASAAIRLPARPVPTRRSPSTSTRPTASRWRTTAT
jgi:hypothetical protein